MNINKVTYNGSSLHIGEDLVANLKRQRKWISALSMPQSQPGLKGWLLLYDYNDT